MEYTSYSTLNGATMVRYGGGDVTCRDRIDYRIKREQQVLLHSIV